MTSRRPAGRLSPAVRKVWVHNRLVTATEARKLRGRRPRFVIEPPDPRDSGVCGS
jgi:hypothetical protein